MSTTPIIQTWAKPIILGPYVRCRDEDGRALWINKIQVAILWVEDTNIYAANPRENTFLVAALPTARDAAHELIALLKSLAGEHKPAQKGKEE